MGREVKLFKSKIRRERGEIADFLRQLADKIDEGRVALSQGEEELILDLPGALILEVQVEDEQKRRKGVQHSLEVELKWFDNMQVDSGLSLK